MLTAAALALPGTVQPLSQQLDLPLLSADMVREDAQFMTHTRTQPTLPCPACQDTMQLVRHLDLKGLPEISIFYCRACEHVETVKQDRAA